MPGVRSSRNWSKHRKFSARTERRNSGEGVWESSVNAAVRGIFFLD
jgi:hypothetical protein